MLGTLNLTAQNTNNCTGDPTGNFCNWTAVGATFAGLARSIDFGGVVNQVAIDDITFGSASAGDIGNPIPEPTTVALMLVGLAGWGVRRKLSGSSNL